MHDKFVEILVRKAKELTIGDGFDEKSGGGPVVSVMVFSLFSSALLRLFLPSINRALRALWLSCSPSPCLVFGLATLTMARDS